jgi:SUN domain-containing protein 1/2
MTQHLGRPSFANNAAAAVLAKAADFAPTPAGPASRLGFASPGVHSRLPDGTAGGTVTQRRTVGRTVGRVNEDDDFRYNEAGATASTHGRRPTMSLGVVLLCALIAVAVSLSTGVTSSASPSNGDARALAARVKAVSVSLDAMTKALSEDTKAFGKTAKLDKATARELAALKEEVASVVKARKSESSKTAAPNAASAKQLAALREEMTSRAAADAKTLSSLRRDVEALTDSQKETAKELASSRELISKLVETQARDSQRWNLRDDSSKHSDVVSKVDYALFSGGGKVVGHSPLSALVAKGEGPLTNTLKSIRGGVHPRADEWVLSGGGGFRAQPGECLALEGDSGFVDVRLRESVRVTAVTLEHVERSIAYDLSSAPKVVVVTGWNGTKAPPASGEKGSVAAIGMARYRLDARGEASATQTFRFDTAANEPGAVDHVRFEVRSNYGNEAYTCLYRLRVHGAPALKPRDVRYD